MRKHASGSRPGTAEEGAAEPVALPTAPAAEEEAPAVAEEEQVVGDDYDML